MKKFNDFIKNKDRDDTILEYSKKHGVHIEKTELIVDYLLDKKMLNEENFKSCLSVMNISERETKQNNTEDSFQYLNKFFIKEREKKESINKRFDKIFENFVKPINGKCPDGYILNKKIGGCLPKGPVLHDMSMPEVGKVD